MGAVAHDAGTTFRVWAPHATSVAVVGSFNDWDAARNPLARDDRGKADTWSADVAGVAPGAEYRFVLQTPAGDRNRLDPRARRLTNSVGNAVVYDPAAFDWGDAEFHQPPWNDLVIYELHVGTFGEGVRGRPGTLEGVRRRLPYLRSLGIGAIQLMPPFEFAGDRSWGYNTAYPFAVESTYGSPDDLKALVRDAHAAGIAVILDVVYNHLGPSDLDIWQFDGWSENGKGGIYFYEDARSTTPWGETRPDYGRNEVRVFLRDSAIQWLEEFRVDGLRWDATAYISSIGGGGRNAPDRIDDGWRFMADVNAEIAERYPGRLTIAEDLRSDLAVVRPRGEGGAGFGAQWDGAFVHFVRAALIATNDADRDVTSVAGSVVANPADAFKRVIFTESHDEDANGSARVPEEIWPGYADSWASKKRATLGIGRRPDDARDPDAVPGPGTRGGLVVQRRGRARLVAPPSPRGPAPSPSRPDLAPSQHERRLARPARPERHRPPRQHGGRCAGLASVAGGRPARRRCRPRELLSNRVPGLPHRRAAAGPLARPVQQRLGWLRPGVRDGGLARRRERGRRRRTRCPSGSGSGWGRTR